MCKGDGGTRSFMPLKSAGVTMGLVQVAVHGVPDRGVIRKSKTHVVDGRGRHQGGQNQSRHGEKLDAPRAQLAQGVGVVAQLIVRKDINLETSLALGLDGCRSFGCTHIEWMRGRHVVGELVGEFGLLSTCNERHTNKATSN